MAEIPAERVYKGLDGMPLSERFLNEVAERSPFLDVRRHIVWGYGEGWAAGVQAGREQATYRCGECNEKLFWHSRWGVWVHDTDDVDLDRRHAPVVRQGLARGDNQEPEPRDLGGQQ